MTYRETLDWMFAQLPMYQRQGASAYKIDLGNTLKLSTYLGNPESHFKSIHIAGTNGKGSTSHILASILQESGYKVGLYTSPHLKDFRERIRINGEKISEKFVIEFIEKHQTFFTKNELSFFEMTVGMAFHFFEMSKVDIAVVEVGLGGRLDSTNIITPEVSVITNIGLDHTRFLGDTLAKIAGEKAGIIKRNVPVVIGRTTPETEKVFREKAKITQSRLYLAEEYKGQIYPCELKGEYQKENVKTTLQTVKILKEKGWDIEEINIENGLKKIVRNTGLLGRWQILQQNPKVICDTAHNTDGLTRVVKQLLEEKYQQLHIVLGMVNDKDLSTVLPILPKKAQYYFCKPDIPRGLNAELLKEKASTFNLFGKKYNSVSEAYKAALQQATDRDLIYVGGSTFVVAEII